VAGDGSRPSYSRKTRLKVERLYLANGLAPKEIAERVGISAQAVSNLVYKHGWAEKRRQKEAAVLARAEDRVSTSSLEFVESVAVQSQELAEKGFQMARQVSGDDREKAFAMAMKGTQIAVQLARQAIGLDAKGGAAGAREHAATFVFCRFGEASEKRAEPVDVKAEPVSDGVILDFEQSQQGSDSRAESAPLIGNRAQVVENARAN